MGDLNSITKRAAPVWAPSVDTVASPGAEGDPNQSTVAYVQPGQNRINVVHPEMYSEPIAAHELTHAFQNTRSGDFQRGINARLPNGAQSAKDYDYGGTAGLRANPRKSIADYNPEQGAQMVEDLTADQGKLNPKMNPQQLRQWDQQKQTLERPIQQMLNVAPKDTSMAGRADDWLADRPLGQMINHPFTRLKGLVSPQRMNPNPPTMPEPPSEQLGYAVRSKLVR
jgi:hypothetical protein